MRYLGSFPDMTSTGSANIFVPLGTYSPGDTLLDNDRTLAAVDAVMPTENEDESRCMLTLYTTFLGTRLGLCEGVKLSKGEVTADPVPVEGTHLKEGDFALSTDTGCLARLVKRSGISGIGIFAKLEGICTILTDMSTPYLDEVSF